MIELEIACFVVREVMAIPNLVTFGQIGRGEEASREFTLRAADAATEVREVVLEDERFRLRELEGSEDGRRFVIEVVKLSEFGRFGVDVVVRYALTDGEPKEMTVPVRGEVVGDLRYAKTVNLFKRGDTYPGHDFVITSRSNTPVKVIEATASDPALSVEIREAEGQRALIHMGVVDPSQDFSTPVRGTVKIKTTDQDEPEVEIAFVIADRGVGAGAAQLRGGGLRPGQPAQGMELKDGDPTFRQAIIEQRRRDRVQRMKLDDKSEETPPPAP